MTGFTMLGVAVCDVSSETPRLRNSGVMKDPKTQLRFETDALKYEAQLATVRYLLETCKIAPIEMELIAENPQRNAAP